MPRTGCKDESSRFDDLDWIVPHRANRRIIEASRSSLPVQPGRVVNTSADTGNASSSGLPLTLQAIETRLKTGERVGPCPSGSGFTFGAAIRRV